MEQKKKSTVTKILQDSHRESFIELYRKTSFTNFLILGMLLLVDEFCERKGVKK